jgi:hypothetical protein
MLKAENKSLKERLGRYKIENENLSSELDYYKELAKLTGEVIQKEVPREDKTIYMEDDIPPHYLETCKDDMTVDSSLSDVTRTMRSRSSDDSSSKSVGDWLEHLIEGRGNGPTGKELRVYLNIPSNHYLDGMNGKQVVRKLHKLRANPKLGYTEVNAPIRSSSGANRATLRKLLEFDLPTIQE